MKSKALTKRQFAELEKQISKSAKIAFEMWGERFFLAGLFGGEWSKQKAEFLKLYKENFLAFHGGKRAEHKKEIAERLKELDNTDVKSAVQYCASWSVAKAF
jgi:hypothetical protein